MASVTKIGGRAVVKAVTSGDHIVVRGQPKNGPPAEKTIIFSNIDAGKLAKRGNDTIPASGDGEYAWAARETLRKKIIGKEVYFKVQDMTDRNISYGVVYLGTDETGENLTEWSIASGNCKVRDNVKKQVDQHAARQAQAEAKDGESQSNIDNDPRTKEIADLQKLLDLQEKAEQEGLGRWATDRPSPRENIVWSVSDADVFLANNLKTKLPAILEHVFNASMMRINLPTLNTFITLSLTGIRAPGERGPNGKEEFFDISKFFVESRLLNKDISITIEGVAPNMGNTQKEPLFVGTVHHPVGNIAEALLKEGYAKCVDWSMGMLSTDPAKYRNAEKAAKLANKRIWKNFIAPDANIPESERSFSGKVLKIENTDSITVDAAGTPKTIFFASVRPVRSTDLQEDVKRKFDKMSIEPKSTPKGRGLPYLYTVPYMFEAREFLRKKLINKKVDVVIDYIRPRSEENGQVYPERTCCTVRFQGQNVAEGLVAKGYAMPIRHRHDDNNRASEYDALRDAESKAEKAGKGCFSKSVPEPMKVSDVSQEQHKARSFFTFLKGKKNDAIVDHVFSGSRLKLFVAKETCLLTFLIGGIQCPRGSRPVGNGVIEPAEPFGEEALAYTKSLLTQRDVTIEVETMDKVGGFVGYIFVDRVNVSLKLVEQGLSKVHYSGKQGKYANELIAAEERAQAAKLGLWKDWTPPVEEVAPVESYETKALSRAVSPKDIVITEVTANLCFYGQMISEQEKLTKLTDEMRTYFTETPPTAGAYKAKRNDICGAIFAEDGLWYRGKIEKISRDGSEMATITFIDYGNRALVHVTKLASLPAQFSLAVLAGQANEYQLALVKPPSDEDSCSIALNEFISLLESPEQFSVNDENLREGSTSQVTLTRKGEDVGEMLLSQGFCTTVKKAPAHLSDLHKKYLECQESARKNRLNLWRYGDITEDDDNEFGMRSEKK